MNADTYAEAQQDAGKEGLNNGSGRSAVEMPQALVCCECVTGLAQLVWFVTGILKVVSGSPQCGHERTYFLYFLVFLFFLPCIPHCLRSMYEETRSQQEAHD